MFVEYDDDNMGGVGCKKKEIIGFFGKGFFFVDYILLWVIVGVMGYV